MAKYTKAHIIVILIHGGPLDVSWLQQSDRVGAILTAWYPGQVRVGLILPQLLSMILIWASKSVLCFYAAASIC